MLSSILPLVQVAQVTLGPPKDVKKEERQKYYHYYEVSM